MIIMKRFKLQLIVITVGLLLSGISFALTTIDKPEPAAPVWDSNCELVDGNYYVKDSLKKEPCSHADVAPDFGLAYTTGVYVTGLSLLLIVMGFFWLIVGSVATRLQLLFRDKNNKP